MNSGLPSQITEDDDEGDDDDDDTEVSLKAINRNKPQSVSNISQKNSGEELEVIRHNKEH